MFLVKTSIIKLLVVTLLTLEFSPSLASEVNLLTNRSGLHSVRDTIRHAALLVSKGGSEEVEIAERMIRAVIGCQEQRSGHANHGNFLWYSENEAIEDLNAVAFTLSTMIPMMIRHGDRLSADLQERIAESIRLGLLATERLDVSLGYTNIALLDIENSCLGGELLRDEAIATRGRKKLRQWMAFTDRFGTTYEYNSPTYTGVAIESLSRVAELSKDQDTRIRARTALARIGLSVALHVHSELGVWAGPHSRAYHRDLARVSDTRVTKWVRDGVLPCWTIDVVKDRPKRMQVDETAYPDFNMGITTYHSQSFSLGVSVNEGLAGQGNALISQFQRGTKDVGILYSRYLVNDKWMGTFVHPTDQTTTSDLLQEGRFYGVQQGPRAIGVYSPSRLQYTTSAKSTLIWTNRTSVDEILINHQPIYDLPVEVSPHDTVVVCIGDSMTAIRPLKYTDLGYQSPIQLTQVGDDLVLEIFNYRGPKKVFWQLHWPGGFFKGIPRSGFYLEMAERADYLSAEEFSREVASGELIDAPEPPYTYDGIGKRLWKIEYRRNAKKLGIELDLMKWGLMRRWNENGEIGWPMLDSPIARESKRGQIEIGDARLKCGKEPAWLFSSPKTNRWVAGYHGSTPSALTLIVPGGKVEIEQMEIGTVFWDDGKVTVDAVGIQSDPHVVGGSLRK